jgi:hypothetical protein
MRLQVGRMLLIFRGNPASQIAVLVLLSTNRLKTGDSKYRVFWHTRHSRVGDFQLGYLTYSYYYYY